MKNKSYTVFEKNQLILTKMQNAHFSIFTSSFDIENRGIICSSCNNMYLHCPTKGHGTLDDTCIQWYSRGQHFLFIFYTKTEVRSP